MDSGLLFFVMAICAFVLVGLGGLALLKVPTRYSQTERTDQILRKLAFQDAQKTKKELNDYFFRIVGSLTKANFCFAVAFIILSLTVEAMNPGITIFQAMGRVLLFAWIPFLVSGIAKHQVIQLRSYYIEKLNEK